LRFSLNQYLLTSIVVIFAFNAVMIEVEVEEIEEVNQPLRNRDKMKDDAIAQLSDQVMALTARMQEFERKQQ
jgi:hypothetical protein